MAKLIHLRDLLRAGLLEAGEELVCEPRQGEVYKATVREDGLIFYNGIRFDTPSGWARYVANNQRDGWRDVKARGQPLDHFRKLLPGGSKSAGLTSATASARRMEETPPSPEREDFQPDIHQRLLGRLQRLEPTQFEHVVGEFLKAKGITEIQVTGHSSDGGIDATGTIPFVNVKVAVQAKRYASGNNVGIEPVQRLRGSMASGYDRGIFITTSSFSPAARGWVEETGAPVTLIDGNELVSQMIDLPLGIIEKPVVETEVDESFFGRLGA